MAALRENLPESVSCPECQVGQEEVVVMPLWSPAHEHFGVDWSLLSCVLLRSFVLITWWNHRLTDSVIRETQG